jgi:hypothetical protein
MSVISSNQLPLTGFKLNIGSDKFKNLQHFAVSATFPSVSVGEVIAGYKNYNGFVSGEKLTYDPFSLRVAVDENLLVYDEIYSWMLHNTKEASLQTHDITLNFISSHNNISKSVLFTNAFPTSIGGIDLNVQNTDVEYAYIDVAFRYDYFKFLG